MASLYIRDEMELWKPVLLSVFMSLEIFADVQSSLWRRDVNYVNTEFQSFLSKSRVTLLEECFLICSASPHCLFTTFRSSTRECKMYSILEGPVQVTSTSLWKRRNGSAQVTHTSTEDTATSTSTDTPSDTSTDKSTDTSLSNASQLCIALGNGKALKFFDEFVTNYTIANKTCVSIGGHLAIVNSLEKLEQLRLIVKQNKGNRKIVNSYGNIRTASQCIRELLSGKFWWIGGVKTAVGYEWIDGRPMNLTDGSWAPDNPTGTGDCVRYGVLKRFDDTRCRNDYNFVCEIDQTNC